MPRRFAPALCLALLIGTALAGSTRAVTLDFEDLGANLPIAGDAFYSGCNSPSGPPTDFASSGATFNNDTLDFGSCFWQGWAYSQTTDPTTPGFGNQYSAIPGSGAGGSATYGVAFTGGQVGAQGPITRITFASEVSVTGAQITNTTYAALSMQDGDGFAKQFGGTSGDDPDYLLLTITGRDALDAITGSVEFALADYRFADNALDYILTQWTFVDLTGLGPVAALEFSLDSSDQSFGFLNTPSYFALDDLQLVPEPGSAALLAFGLALLARRRS
jgi:hypothetical protein